MQLFQVSDYIAETRVMLQDTVNSPFRYSDDNILMALNQCMGEIARLRPDILMDVKYQTRLNPQYRLSDNIPPTYTSANENAVVPVPGQYKLAVLQFMCGMTQIIDTEDTTDARATGFMSMFAKSLSTL